MATIKNKPSDDWRNKRSQEQLMLGGLPLNAEFRLRKLNENKRFFTSSLSVNEFVLARAERIVPLGQVTGNCSYHVGWQPAAVQRSMELRTISRAYNEAWRLALSRLQAEASILGAHGVVGVTLKARPSVWSDRMLEVSAQGTAIQWQGAKVGGIKVGAAPFISALSGQEFWALLSAGYCPVGVAYGTFVYQQVTTNVTRWVTDNGLFSSAARANQELQEYTSGFYKSRHGAIRYMEAEANALGAEGVVGVSIEKEIALREVEFEQYEGEKKQKRTDLVVRFFVLGTAISHYIEYQPIIRAVMPLS